jgi:hypothetical protein
MGILEMANNILKFVLALALVACVLFVLGTAGVALVIAWAAR